MDEKSIKRSRDRNKGSGGRERNSRVEDHISSPNEEMIDVHSDNIMKVCHFLNLSHLFCLIMLFVLTNKIGVLFEILI